MEHQEITCQTGKERVDDNDAVDLIRWIRRNSNMDDRDGGILDNLVLEWDK